MLKRIDFSSVVIGVIIAFVLIFGSVLTPAGKSIAKSVFFGGEITSIGLGTKVPISTFVPTATMLPSPTPDLRIIFPDNPQNGSLLGTLESPFNDAKISRKVYVYNMGISISVFVLTLTPREIMKESWSRWNMKTVGGIRWIDKDHLSFLGNGRPCIATIGDDLLKCQ